MAEESELESRARKRVGTVLRGKYHLDGLLGAGGMAAVYTATHRNQKQFAVKMLHAELSMHGDIRARFLREGYAANSVKHPGAVAVMDDDTAEDGSAFLVMELLEGKTVEGWWEECGHRLPLEAVLGIAHQLLDVLAAAHSKGIVHRDIKPANLFVTSAGEVKVLDFGIARVRAAAASDAGVTGTGVLLGTPLFMAPEQALGKSSEIDARTDLWATGATMFTLLTGQPVHTGETAQHLMVRCATTPARSLATLSHDTPTVVIDLVDRALLFERDARWASAAAMRDAVRAAHERVFGRPPSAAVLAALLGGRSSGPAASLESTQMAGLDSGVASKSNAARTTAGAVTSPLARTAPMPTTTSPRGRAMPILLGLTAVAVIGGGGFVVLRSHRAGATVDSHAMTPSATATSPIATAVEPIPQAPGGSASSPPMALAASAASPAPPAPSNAMPGHRAGTPVAPLPRPPPATSATTKANCSPPYYLDADGNEHFKPECFK